MSGCVVVLISSFTKRLVMKIRVTSPCFEGSFVIYLIWVVRVSQVSYVPAIETQVFLTIVSEIRYDRNKHNNRTVKIASLDPSIKMANTNPVKQGQALSAKTAPRTVKVQRWKLRATATDDCQLQKL